MARAAKLDLRTFQQELATRLASKTAAQVESSRLGLSCGGENWLVRLADAAEVIAVPPCADVPLTTGEFAVLKAFARHPRVPLSREKLMEMARGREYEAFDRSLDVQISRLRKLVEPDPTKPRYIQTVWGLGYVFIPDGQG
jgi:hypothetical protein